MSATHTSVPAPARAAARAWLDGLAVALIALYVGVFAVRNVPLQSDFRTYVAAVRAVQHGQDPYVVEHLRAQSAHVIQPFVYPLASLALLAPVAALPQPAVAWMVVKLALLAGLVAVWARGFVPRAGLLPVALVAVFGCNGSALWDLRTGNLGIVEAAVVWSALACYVAGRRHAFAALVVAAACFKLVPAAFLLLLLVPAAGRAASVRACVAWSAVLGVIVVAPVLAGPFVHQPSFLGAVPVADYLGDANPSLIGLLTILIERAGLPLATAARVAWGAWFACAAALLAASAPLLRDAWERGDARRWAMIAVFLYAILAPRPMAYGFVLVAPAALYFAPRPFDRPIGTLLLALVLAAQGLTRAANQGSTSLVYMYAPCLLTLSTWLLVVAGERRPRAAAAPLEIPLSRAA